jgi:hypothetical protein
MSSLPLAASVASSLAGSSSSTSMSGAGAASLGGGVSAVGGAACGGGDSGAVGPASTPASCVWANTRTGAAITRIAHHSHLLNCTDLLPPPNGVPMLWGSYTSSACADATTIACPTHCVGSDTTRVLALNARSTESCCGSERILAAGLSVHEPNGLSVSLHAPYGWGRGANTDRLMPLTIASPARTPLRSGSEPQAYRASRRPKPNHLAPRARER